MSAVLQRARRIGPRDARGADTPRYRLMRVVNNLIVRLFFDVRTEGLERWPAPPFQIVCNHHAGWDPMIVIAATPAVPRITWFGPREADFSVGFKNRVMGFFGGVIPFTEETSLVSAVRTVRHVFEARGILGIFAEGRVGFRETGLLPFEDGAVAFATAGGVPIVPCAIVGSSVLYFRRRVVVRFGDPIETTGARGAKARAEIEERVRQAILDLEPRREPPLPRRRPLAWIGDILDGEDDKAERARDVAVREREQDRRRNRAGTGREPADPAPEPADPAPEPADPAPEPAGGQESR